MSDTQAADINAQHMIGFTGAARYFARPCANETSTREYITLTESMLADAQRSDDLMFAAVLEGLLAGLRSALGVAR